MTLLPMNTPAEIHRLPIAGGAGLCIVAQGPLAIMAYGLMAIDPADRGGFRISTAAGDLSAAEAEAALRQWEDARRERRDPA